jgi:VanZ family protein
MVKIQAFLRQWGPSLVMMAAIFCFSSIPSAEMPSVPGFWDTLLKKGGHMLGFGLLALSYGHGLSWSRKRWWLLPWLLVVLYAGSDEFHQRFVAGRHSSVVDVGIDSLGAGLALLLRYLH